MRKGVRYLVIQKKTVLNYAIFLAIINKNLPSRELLVLDEAHLLETEVVKLLGISISHKKWRKYILDLKIDNHGDKYDVIRWLSFDRICNFYIKQGLLLRQSNDRTNPNS